MKSIVEKAGDALACTLLTRPLAVFSVLTFIFIVLRLYGFVESLLLLFVLIGLLLTWLYSYGKINLFIIFFMCTAMLLGTFSANVKIQRVNRITYMLNGQYARVEGHVASVPVVRKNGTRFFFECDKIYSHKGICDESVKIYINDRDNISYNLGDALTLNVRFSDIRNANSRYSRSYLAKGAILQADSIVLLDKSEMNFEDNFIYGIRNYILRVGDKFFEGDTKALFKALAAGDRSEFSKKLSNDLSESGLSHVASVSGLHVSVLGMAVYNLLKRKNRHIAGIMSVAGAVLFALITGSSPPALRSALMFSMFMISNIILMENDGFTSLTFSAMVLSIINPYSIFDWGFILSFLSVLGIQVFYPSFKRFFSFMPEILADSSAVTISAQLMTLPAVASMFGYLSVYAVASNIVISFVFVWILYLCFTFVFLSAIPVLNGFTAIICTFFLDIIPSVAYLFASLPHSTVWISDFDIWLYIVYYGAVLMFILLEKLSLRAMYLISIISLILLIMSRLIR